MQEMAVQWRDVQIQIDDFHDRRLEMKQKLRQRNSPVHQSNVFSKLGFYRIQEETTKQVRTVLLPCLG